MSPGVVNLELFQLVAINKISGPPRLIYLNDRRPSVTPLLLRSGSCRKEIGHENEKQQCIDNNTDNRRRKDASLAVGAHTKQGNDSGHKTHYDEKESDTLNDKWRSNTTA